MFFPISDADWSFSKFAEGMLAASLKSSSRGQRAEGRERLPKEEVGPQESKSHCDPRGHQRMVLRFLADDV